MNKIEIYTYMLSLKKFIRVPVALNREPNVPANFSKIQPSRRAQKFLRIQIFDFRGINAHF